MQSLYDAKESILATTTSVNASSTTEKIGDTVTYCNYYTKPKQKRNMKHDKKRHARNYWCNIQNLEMELRSFWTTLQVPISPPPTPPPIPNETLLNHFERHDLRYGISSQGGRDAVAFRLKGAKIIPGSWKEAVQHCWEVQHLLDNHDELSRDFPPPSPQQKLSLKTKHKKEEVTVYNDMECKSTSMQENSTALTKIGNANPDTSLLGKARWAHLSNRKAKGYWTQTVLLQELYDYLETRSIQSNRPCIWMPQPSELQAQNRNDLKQAIYRFGGVSKICRLAKLVPYKEWRYFESLYELFVQLQQYLKQQHISEFPPMSEIQRNGPESLYDLIMNFGGRVFLANKLNMKLSTDDSIGNSKQKRGRPTTMLLEDIRFGSFSLDFAGRLMQYIRNDMKKVTLPPPANNNRKTSIVMPSVEELRNSGERLLASEVEKFGGMENVARRLGLALVKTDV